MTAEEFLQALFGDHASPEARIAVWCSRNGQAERQSKWFVECAPAAEYALSKAADCDVYFGVGLYRPGVPKRGCADDVVCITSLWADLDFGPHHKKQNLPPDEAACRKLLERIGLAPSLIVHSGHGLQPYWLLKEPVTAAEGAARLAARWGATILGHAEALGYATDSVWSLAQVLRVPGTHNRKREPVVEVRCEGDPRLWYDVTDIEEMSIGDEYVPGKCVVPVDSLVLPKAADFDLSILEKMRRESRFSAIWDHKRPDLPSASEYDLALANVCVLAGLTDQQIADLIYARRRLHKENPGKAERRKYLTDTIGLAKSLYESERAINAVNRGVDKPEPGNLSDPRRTKVIDTISKALGVPVARWIQIGTTEAEYALILADGTRIRFRSVREYRSQQIFGDKLLEAKQTLPKRLKGATWDKLVGLLASIVEIEDDPDTGPRNQAQAWLEIYLRTYPKIPDNPDEAIELRGPLLRAGRLHVLLNDVLKAINEVEVPRITSREIRSTMRAAGFAPTPVKPEREGLRCTRFWRDDHGVAEALLGRSQNGEEATNEG